MKIANLVFSDLAVTDILEQADWYDNQSGRRLALRWENSVTATVLRIIDRPAAGAICVFKAEQLEGIRRIRVSGFSKHLVFYKLLNDQIVILRVVHGARDLESLFLK